jgi:phospholipid/cholesterol/gamma-HCH transport system substrate-binding protein
MRVGVLLLASLAVAVFAIFFIGKETSLFSLKNEYFIRFQSVSGLKAGNPVQLNGVEVGTVERVILPEDPDESTIQVWITIERRYAERVRQDSQGRIKTLGLLGDKYVEITSGSPEAPQVASGEEIPAAPATDVDALLASGEDTMDNVVAISASLKSILERMESGEGLLGQLTANTPEGERFSESVVRTMETVERVANKIEPRRHRLRPDPDHPRGDLGRQARPRHGVHRRPLGRPLPPRPLRHGRQGRRSRPGGLQPHRLRDCRLCAASAGWSPRSTARPPRPRSWCG